MTTVVASSEWLGVFASSALVQHFILPIGTLQILVGTPSLKHSGVQDLES